MKNYFFKKVSLILFLLVLLFSFQSAKAQNNWWYGLNSSGEVTADCFQSDSNPNGAYQGPLSQEDCNAAVSSAENSNADTGSSGGSGLVPCGVDTYPAGTFIEGQDVSYMLKDPCKFADIFTLINNVTNFLILVLALPIAAIMFAYAGFLFMFSGMQPEARSKAKRIFGKVVLGFMLSVGAWLIVHTILSILGYNGSWIGL